MNLDEKWEEICSRKFSRRELHDPHFMNRDIGALSAVRDFDSPISS